MFENRLNRLFTRRLTSTSIPSICDASVLTAFGVLAAVVLYLVFRIFA